MLTYVNLRNILIPTNHSYNIIKCFKQTSYIIPQVCVKSQYFFRQTEKEEEHMEARAVRECQEPGLEVKCFSARVPVNIYNSLTDWAWENRVSMAKALTELLTEGLKAKGKRIPESEG